jgi:hypothetical protein
MCNQVIFVCSLVGMRQGCADVVSRNSRFGSFRHSHSSIFLRGAKMALLCFCVVLRGLLGLGRQSALGQRPRTELARLVLLILRFRMRWLKMHGRHGRRRKSRASCHHNQPRLVVPFWPSIPVISRRTQNGSIWFRPPSARMRSELVGSLSDRTGSR